MEKILGILKSRKVLKIGIIILIVSVCLTALYFLGGKVCSFFQQNEEVDDFSGMPCYNWGVVAVIEIRGEIVSYFLYTADSEKIDDPDAYDAVSSEEVVSCINDAEMDDNIMGIIIEIDSGGGSPFASEEIMKAINGLDKPSVAVIRESAVSGGYLIASATDRIFASELSDIGGIGVTMSYLDYSRQNEQDGIIYQQLSAGRFKDTGDPDKPLTYEEKQLLMRDTNLMHDIFINYVATNRGLDIKKVRTLADGSSMLGAMAEENGLIDEIGDIYSALYWLVGD